MAYAAVISLLGVIDGLFDSRRISLGSSTRECLQSVYDHARSLATKLERFSKGVGALEEEVIIEEARRLEDSIEFPLSTHILLLQSQIGEPTFSLNLDADSFAQTVRKVKENIEEVLDAITAQLNLHDQKMIVEGSFDQRLCRIVTLRKSLIVLDDVWGSLNFLLHESLFGKGTWILVTSREHNDFRRFACNLKMRFMDEEESWELLRRNVFGEEECPPQLLKPGKKIAEHCEGLPLLINAVAPILLSEAQRNPECWKRVAEKPHSVLEKASHQISEVLLSSYHPLTQYEKLCFLYLAAFPLKCIV